MSDLASRFRSRFYGLPVFLSACLLFSVEPLLAKRILPWFGGSAAVWSTCLVFYQTALLLGYGYAALLARWRNQKMAAVLHAFLVATSLLLLAVGPSQRWADTGSVHPEVAIFEMLTASVGLPFLLLASTSPLVQMWAARAGVAVPYRLFAVSNLASLCALLAYPTVIEPVFSTNRQSTTWSALYLLYAVLIVITAFRSKGSTKAFPSDRTFLLPTTWLAWFALSACGAVLLLAVTNHITENMAAVPLLWVLPLAVYLSTFILAFGNRRTLNRALWLRLLAFALGTLGYSIYQLNAVTAIQVSVPVFLAGLFVCCYFCHSELHRLRPQTEHLTSFYLAIAAGGAAGAIAIGSIAPSVFNGVYELPVALTFTAALAALLVWAESGWPLRLLWLAVTVCMGVTIVSNVQAYHENTLALRRSFYGSLRVVQNPHAGPEQIRTLFHGTIEHGAQYIQLPLRRRAISYYGPDSGVGILLREFPKAHKRVAVVGLGTGTLAAYGNPGDTFRFFEINPQVIDIAQSLFWYTRESAARTEFQVGDGRLSLAGDQGALYDVIVLDAFSGDAIPVHLLTKEAMDIYRRRLQSDGALAIHVSNDFLDLAPVVLQMARPFGLQAILIHNPADPSLSVLPADWVIVTNNSDLLSNRAFQLQQRPIAISKQLRPWTDDYNSLIDILKSPQVSFDTSHSY